MFSLDGRPLWVRRSPGRSAGRWNYLCTDNHDIRVPLALFTDTVLSRLRKLKHGDIDGSLRADEWTDRIADCKRTCRNANWQSTRLTAHFKELPVERWPERAVARMAEMEPGLKNAKELLRQAKEQGRGNTRIETLQATQAICEYLNGLPEGPERHGGDGTLAVAVALHSRTYHRGRRRRARSLSGSISRSLTRADTLMLSASASAIQTRRR